MVYTEKRCDQTYCGSVEAGKFKDSYNLYLPQFLDNFDVIKVYIVGHWGVYDLQYSIYGYWGQDTGVLWHHLGIYTTDNSQLCYSIHFNSHRYYVNI